MNPHSENTPRLDPDESGSPPREGERLADLHELHVLDTPAEPEFDDLIHMASLIAGTQMAMLSLVDSDRQWFKARTGIDLAETPRDISFCDQAIRNPDEAMIVEDARLDPRFADSPLVTGEPEIGFYAGVPIVTSKGHAIGTICVADREPGRLSEEQVEALRGVSRQAAALLEMRRRANTLGSVLQRERNRAAEFLEWQRTHDSVTALPVRAELEKRIDQLADGAALNGRAPTASAVVIDATGVGQVNAAYGREAGDSVIRELAWVLAERLPADALLARIDGTAFAAVIPDADLSLAGAISQEIHSRLAEPINAEGTSPVTLSAVIGSASCCEGSGIAASDLLPAAEAAAAEAKSLGPRSTVAAGSDTVSAHAREARMRNALAAAIRSGALAVAYMPIVRLSDREVCGHEALARWRDPEFGQVSPMEFIALAEQHGMVAEIDDLILRAALADFSAGLVPSPSVSVNVSPSGIDAGLAGRVTAALDEFGVEPSRLNVEITERAGLCDSRGTCDAVAELKALGVKVALDDFGAGVTSLAHLRSLPITDLKIDRSLVSDLVGPDAERARLVVEAIASMAKGLGLETVAEGIEHESQAETLLAAGIDFGQGYLFGRAVGTGRPAGNR